MHLFCAESTFVLVQTLFACMFGKCLNYKSADVEFVTGITCSASVNSFWAGLFMCEIQPRVLEMIAQKNRQLKHPQLSIFAEKSWFTRSSWVELKIWKSCWCETSVKVEFCLPQSRWLLRRDS